MSRQLVVIGAGMGGLSAAIHARLAGWDVLVLEQSAVSGGKAAGIRIGNYWLDPGPSIIILPKLYEAVFRAAGRSMSDYLTFRRLDNITRVFFGQDAPLDLPANESACLDLLRQIDPSDAVSLGQLLNKLGKVEPLLDETVYARPFLKPTDLMNLKLLRFGMGFNPMKTYRQLVDGLFRSPLVRAFFYGFPSYGGQSYSAKSPGAFLIPYYMLRDGVYFPEGGVRAIPVAFEKLARDLGVEFRFGAKTTEVIAEKGRMRSVRLADGEIVEADAFISNIDRSTFAGLRQKPIDLEPSYSYFTVHRGIRREFPDLAHHNLIIPPNFERGFEELYSENRFPTEPIVYINSTGGMDPDAAPSGCSNVFAVATSPAMVQGIDWKSKASTARCRVDQALISAGLDWEDHELDFERIQTPEYFEAAHGNYRGSLYGLHEKHRLMGMFPASNRDENWANLAFCGGSVQPGAGLPMTLLSGKFAVELLK